MDKTLRVLILLLLAVPLPAQILAPIVLGSSSGAGGSTTNVSYVGGAWNETSGATTSAITYTCASTSNRLVLIADTGNGFTFTLTDTGGQASGATVLTSGSWSGGGDNYEAWNMGCASASNTITVTISSTNAIIFQLAEYSGLGSGSDAAGAAVGSSTACSATATASQAHDLLVGYTGFGYQTSYINPGVNYSWRIFTSPGSAPSEGYPYNYAFGTISDNLNAASGSVTFASAFPSAVMESRCLNLLIPGTAATNPGFYPYIVQSTQNGGCNSGSGGNAIATRFNVTSGDVLVFAFNSENTTAPTSVSDTLGTSWTLQTSQANGTSNELWIYTGVATASGADTVTANGSGFSYPQAGITEFGGLAGTVTNTGGQSTGSTNMTWSQTVSNNNSIVFAAVADKGGAATFTIGGTGYAFASVNVCSANSWARVLTSGTSTPIVGVDGNDSNVGASIVLQ